MKIWPPGVGFFIGVCTVALVFFLVHYATLGRVARYERISSEQETRMESYRQTVLRLEESLSKAQKMVARVARLAGIEYEPSIIAPSDSTRRGGVSTSFGAEGAATLDSPAIGANLRPTRRDFTVPVGLPVQGTISRGYEIGVEAKSVGAPDAHAGVDIAVKSGTSVLSTAAGEVIAAEKDSLFGWCVIVRHNDSLSTLYGHNSKLQVSVGQTVAAGGRLALSGNTGRSSAPHVHYEVRKFERAIDPTPFLGGEKLPKN